MSSVDSLVSYVSNMQASQVSEKVSTSVAKTALDNAKFQGQAVLQLLDAASNVPSPDPNVGTLLDTVG